MPRKAIYHTAIANEGYAYMDSVAKPSVAGLAKHIGVSRNSIYNWILENPNFREMVLEIRKKNVLAYGLFRD